jgi:hypothetical protein
MISFIYAAIAIAFLILVLGLSRRTRSTEPDEWILENRSASSIGNGRWLHLSERIFDPSDARWLAEELGFPKLAKTLILARKRLAICWLEALQASFDDLIRTPELSPSDDPKAGSDSGWKMLWLTCRFKISVSYALLVVKLFGPYHRLIPSFSWVPFPRGEEPSFRQAALVQSRGSH